MISVYLLKARPKEESISGLNGVNTNDLILTLVKMKLRNV